MARGRNGEPLSGAERQRRFRAKNKRPQRKSAPEAVPAKAGDVTSAVMPAVTVGVTTAGEAIVRAKELTCRLLSELDAVTTHTGELERAILENTAADASPGRRNAMLKAIGLPARTEVLKTLGIALKAWVELERPAPAAGKTAVAPSAPPESPWDFLDAAGPAN